jgi:hypothetical protein
MNRLHPLLIVGPLVCVLLAGTLVAQENSMRPPGSRPPLTLPPPAVQWTADVTGSRIQNFEGAFPPMGWTNVASGSARWLRAGVSGYGIGNLSAAAAFYNTGPGVSFSLIYPIFIPAVMGDSIIFDHAYCGYGTENDQLEVAVSTNSGTNWTIVATLDGGASGPLATAPAQQTSFTPSATQWATKRYPLAAGVNRIRFRAISAYGNNLFIDNLRGWQAFDYDAAASSIDLPAPTVAPGTYAPKATIGNAGASALTFTATMTITPRGEFLVAHPHLPLVGIVGPGDV